MTHEERSRLANWVTAQLLITLVQSLVIAIVMKGMLGAFESDAPTTSVWAVCIVAVGALRLQRLALPRRRARKRGGLWLSAKQDREVAAEASAARFLGPTRADGRAQPAIMWDAPLPETLERRFARMYRHVDRVTYAVAETRHYDSGVRPVFLEIARDRLRRYHGIDLHAEPDRARAVMGEDLWTALTRTPARTPSMGDLNRWLTALEQLGLGQPTRAG